MKSTLLKITAFFTLICLAGACSTDEASVKNDTAQENVILKRGAFLDGKLADVTSSGAVKITANKNLIKADFEQILADQNIPTALTEILVQLKKNQDDPYDLTYTMIGTNSLGTSIGVMLIQKGNGLYLDDPNFSSVADGFTSTTCRGCASGCNLSFIRLQGHKVFYCNENGCGEFCTKNESAY